MLNLKGADIFLFFLKKKKKNCAFTSDEIMLKNCNSFLLMHKPIFN